MLVKVADNFAVDPETVDAVKSTDVDGVSLVWFNGQDYPYRVNADFETVVSLLKAGKPGFFKKLLQKS